jgi:hypothetical protein
MKADERNTPSKKFIPPLDVTSDPAEREELLMQAEIFSGMNPQKFQ